jgi:hypothetical protein
MRFATDFVDQIAQDVLGRSVREPLRKGEEPYSMLTGTKSDPGDPVGEFAERLFHEVAQQHRHSLKSLGGEKALQATLERKVRKLITEKYSTKSNADEGFNLVCGIAANLFEKSSDIDDRLVAQRALSWLAKSELRQRSLEASAAAYERLLAIEPPDPISQLQDRIPTLEFLSKLYLSLNWPAKLANTYRRIFQDVRIIYYFEGDNTGTRREGSVQFVRPDFDEEAHRQAYGRWKKHYPDVPLDFYRFAAEKTAFAFLGLSELAAMFPTLKPSDGDDQFDPTAFLIRAVSMDSHEHPDASSKSKEFASEFQQTHAPFLKERAYALNGVLGDGAVERIHLDLLHRLLLKARNDDDSKGAVAVCRQAVEICERLNDLPSKINSLNDLYLASLWSGNAELAANCHEQLKRFVDSYISEPKFTAVVVVESSSPESPGTPIAYFRADRRLEFQMPPEVPGSSRWGLEVDVAVRLEQQFDRNPEEVIERTTRQQDVLGTVLANFGERAEQHNDMAEARKLFENAFALKAGLNDWNSAMNISACLVRVARSTGDKDGVCMYLKDCLHCVQTLRKSAPDDWKDELQAIQEQMESEGCPEHATTPDDRNAD